jgi:hypothetical protein
VAVGMVPSRAMRFGNKHVVFRPLVETVDVVTIAAAWHPKRCKDSVPEIVAIAKAIGARSSVVPIKTVEARQA